MCTRKVKVTMAKRLARGSYDKENDPDLDYFKSSKKSKTVKRFGSPTSESRKRIEIRTNHSLRATGATSTFRGNVPKKIIQNVTGHRSLEALGKYEHISTEQHQAVSKVMISTKPVDYETKIKVASSSECSTTVTTAEDQVRSIFGNVSNCSIGSITLNLSRK